MSHRDVFMMNIQRFGEVIPVPDCLGKEAILIDIFTSGGYLKGQEVLISSTPSLWENVICRYPGFTFQTFFYLFSFSYGIPISIVQGWQSYSQFHIHNFWSQTLLHNFEPFPIVPEDYMYKGPKN